jgi:N-acetylneuraminic acid mutarotase
MKEGTKKFLFSGFFLLMALSVIVTSFFGVAKVNAQEEDSWTTLPPLPEPSSSFGAAAVDGEIYFIGWPTCEKYDPETNNWTTIASVPVGNSGGAVVAYQNKIYLIGGWNEYPTQVYDPVTNTWENRTSIPTKSARISLQANVVDGKIYVIGGRMLAGLYQIIPSSSNDVYDPETDSWSQMAPMPVPVMGYASAVFDNKIYIISGGDTDLDYLPTNLVQIFDPATNQWTNGTSIPNGVVYAGAVATTGLFAPKRIYVIGGTNTAYDRSAYYNVINLNQVYDPETDTWTTGTPMLTPRCDFGVAVVNDEIYAIGGIRRQFSEENCYLIVNEKYTPLDYIPEFPSWIILPLFLTATLSALVFKKRLFHRRS